MEAWQRCHAAWITPFMLGAAARIATASVVLREKLVATGLDSRTEGLALAEELLSMAREKAESTPHLQRLQGIVVEARS